MQDGFQANGGESAASADGLEARILRLLRERGLRVGARVKEQTLADALGVSRTPVRKALRRLVEAGVLSARPNRGHVLARAPSELLAVDLAAPPTSPAALFDRIAVDYLAGGLPTEFAGEQVARSYGASRRLADRALADLVEEGVLDKVAPGRFRFSPALGTDEASDASYLFRLAIEPAIPLLPTFRVERSRLAAARQEHEHFLALAEADGSARLAYRIDAAFHQMIADFGNNAFFAGAVAHQNRLRQLMEYRDYRDRERVRSWCREHMAILAALERDDADRASRLMSEHLANAMRHRPTPPRRNAPGGG